MFEIPPQFLLAHEYAWVSFKRWPCSIVLRFFFSPKTLLMDKLNSPKTTRNTGRAPSNTVLVCTLVPTSLKEASQTCTESTFTVEYPHCRAAAQPAWQYA